MDGEGHFIVFQSMHNAILAYRVYICSLAYAYTAIFANIFPLKFKELI
jgi:hypothetical protein